MKTISDAIIDFVLDDYLDNVWYNGDEPCPTPDELRPYFLPFLLECQAQDRPVPEGLTPEVYCAVWMDEYTRRTAAAT